MDKTIRRNKRNEREDVLKNHRFADSLRMVVNPMVMGACVRNAAGRMVYSGTVSRCKAYVEKQGRL